MDEQIELIARAIFEAHNATYTFGGPAKWDNDPEHWRRYARAAHSVIAGRVAELEEALGDAREAIASLETEALGMAVIGFGDPERDTYPIRDELLAKIDAALAPYPERRSE